jgi:predicted adenylyl cyclase CyaB
MVDNVEIEVKLRITLEQYKTIEKFLQENSILIKSSSQIDEYFTPAHKNYMEPRYPCEWLRIGQRGNKTILTYKHYYPENVDVTTHCDEYETEVADYTQLHKIFELVGAKSIVKVEKARELYKYKDEFEVALDKVEELGYFIEVETIKDFGSVEEAHKKIEEFCHILNLNTSKKEKRGYPYLLMEKQDSLKK